VVTAGCAAGSETSETVRSAQYRAVQRVRLHVLRDGIVSMLSADEHRRRASSVVCRTKAVLSSSVRSRVWKLPSFEIDLVELEHFEERLQRCFAEMLDHSAAIEPLLGSVDDLRLPLGAGEVAALDQLPAQIVFTFLQRFDLCPRIREQIGWVTILAGVHARLFAPLGRESVVALFREALVRRDDLHGALPSTPFQLSST